jgi:hypothetical protein
MRFLMFALKRYQPACEKKIELSRGEKMLRDQLKAQWPDE